MDDLSIVFLHHSTGGLIWDGARASLATKIARRMDNRLTSYVSSQGHLPLLFREYNEKNNSNYQIEEMIFPKGSPYQWSNFPYDYYNIWVKHAGNNPYMEEPTLEILTQKYQVIIFKHCFPVSEIRPNLSTANIDSDLKTLDNYQLQYLALKEKLHEFPLTKFILFTGAVHVEANISKEAAIRSREFFDWVRGEWDDPNDNIFIWDLYDLQTEGDLYLKNEYAVAPNNSHPRKSFASKVVVLLFNRIIDVIENNGTNTTLTGEALDPLYLTPTIIHQRNN